MQCGQFPSGSLNASHDVWQCLHDFDPPFSTGAWKNVAAKQSACATHTFHFGTTPFLYLANSLRTSYWDIAQKYVLGDNFFAVSSTSSFPGHQYIVADQSVDTYGDIVADQPGQTSKPGCFDVPTASITVPALGADGYIQNITRGIGGECYHNATLADRMAEKPKPVTWTHYTSRMWDATNQRFVFSTVFNGFINSKTWYQKTPSWPSSLNNLENDVNRHGVLREVTWVKPPCIPLSDHPSGASTDDSMNWVPTVINWIGQKKALWEHTAIFVVWDDWGGFYDHVVPPITPNHQLSPGARIPFLLISPYGRNGSVIHAPADYASILKFIEDLYDLKPLTDNDKFAHDLAPFFDFTQTPQPFQPVFVKSPYTPDMCRTTTKTEMDIDR
jgi:phospholipase C